MKNIILLQVSDETYEQLKQGTRRIRGTIGMGDGGFDFHEHYRSPNQLAKNRFVHKLKHGRLEMTEKQTCLHINIAHSETTPMHPYEGANGLTAAEIIGREACEATNFLKQRVFNLTYDNPYGKVWNH